MRDEAHETGYDKEEEYFYRKNKELLEAARAKLDTERSEQQAQQLRELHWMRCPKCGQQMAEEERSGIKLDHCAGCGGIFFDKGELELLLATEEPAGFLGALRRRHRR